MGMQTDDFRSERRGGDSRSDEFDEELRVDELTDEPIDELSGGAGAKKPNGSGFSYFVPYPPRLPPISYL